MSVVGQRERGVSDMIDFQRFEQVEPRYRYRTRIFFNYSWNWISHCGLETQFTEESFGMVVIGWETGSIRDREHQETPALTDEL